MSTISVSIYEDQAVGSYELHMRAWIEHVCDVPLSMQTQNEPLKF